MEKGEKIDRELLLPTTAALNAPYGLDSDSTRRTWQSRTYVNLRKAGVLSISMLALFFAVYNLFTFCIRESIGVRYTLLKHPVPSTGFSGQKDLDTSLCPQTEQLIPTQNNELWETLRETYSTEDFRGKAIEWLSGAVKVKTESFDKMGPVGVDPRWDAFGPFHDYLLKAFPLVHSTLTLTKVNTWGLLYEWEGSDPSLKPLLLAAHQDVVPVDPQTVDQWDFPPYSGYYDGEHIWGRGSSDDKSGLIGVLSTVETLLSQDFQPARKVVMAFGFDEETSGIHGAQRLATHMIEKFGENSFAMLIDEGGGFAEQNGAIFAIPAVGEKGAIDVRIDVSSPGGHSSVPPPHTSIGILASLLVEIEAHPFSPKLDRSTPIYGTLKCLAAHAPDMDKKLRHTILKSVNSDHALHKLEHILSTDATYRSYIGTTLAIDLIQGGVKTNALPEEAWAIVNHRIATQSSVEAVKAHDTKLLAKLASQYNLSYNAFGKDVTSGAGAKYGSLALTDAWGTALEPAPITPTGLDAAPYKLLSGTIRATYNSHRNFNNTEEVFVAPGIMTGNTDTRYYWKLTDHIFRYNHHDVIRTASKGGVHTVNESINVDAFLEMIKFFTTLILNADEATEF